MNFQNVYDRLPYPSLSYGQTHPDRLATLAVLLGMHPAPVNGCRVLEMGCAGGGNLIPMAYVLPGSEFLGIDASAVQIDQGRAAVTALGLENLVLKQMDILDIDAGLGQFDYIIVHGVYSWVPPAVQKKILEVCKKNLAPQGVAYVSYNTYPGWHMIDIARGLMLFASRGIDDPEKRAAQARAGLRTLADLGPEESAYGSFLKMYAQLIDGELEDSLPKSNSLLFHDELEEHNAPIYFYQFAEQAADHGLQYLGDLYHQRGGNLPAEVMTELQSLAKTHVELEQYLDFLQNRTFRQTLLCHEDIVLKRSVKPQQVMGFYASSSAKAVSAEPDIHSVSVEQFRGHDGAVLSIDHPVSKAAMLCLAESWPRPMAFAELLSAAQDRLGDGPEPGRTAGTTAGTTANGSDVDAQVLAANLLQAFGYSHSLVELHVFVPPVASSAGEYPEASAVARFLAAQGNSVTNLRHERLAADPMERYLLPYLDGCHDRKALLELLLAGPVAQGILTIEENGQPSRNIRDVLAVEVENSLAWMARAGLLLAPSSPLARGGQGCEEEQGLSSQ